MISMKRVVFLLLLISSINSSAQTTLLFEDFSTGTLSASWSINNTLSPTVGWEFGTALESAGFNIPPYGTYAACNDDKYDNTAGTANLCEKSYLVSPIINCLGSDSLTISFDYYCEQDANGDGAVEFSSNGGSSYNFMFGLNESNSWAHFRLSIPTAFVTSAFRFRFAYSDNNSKATGLAVTNILLFDPPSFDLSIVKCFHSDIMPTQNAFTGYRVKNNGLTTITSFTANVFVDGLLNNSQNYSGLSINYQKELDVKIPAALNTMTAGIHSIRIEITNINGLQTDDDPINNESTFQIDAIANLPDRHPILLEKTGAWCTFCADASWQLDNTVATFPEAIGVSIHGGDMMDSASSNWTGSIFASALYGGGYPKAGCDIYKFQEYNSLSTFASNYSKIAIERSLMYEPIGIQLKNVNWNSLTQTVTATVEASVYDTIYGDMRLNLWVVADELYGTGTGWDQTNGSNTVVGHPYYGLGDPILGFRHHKVLLSMVGGTWGSENIFPDTCYYGDVYQKTYSLQIPSVFWGASNQTNTIDSSNITLIGLAQKYDADILDRRIFNAISSPLSDLITSVPDLDSDKQITVYPNPSTENITVRTTETIDQIIISDGTGRIVLVSKTNSKQIQLSTETLPSGIYFILLEMKSGSVSRSRLVVQ